MSELSVSRDLDAEVAQKIFDQTPCAGYEHRVMGVAGHGWVKSDCAHPEGACYPGEMGPYAYSTDMNMAWLVIDRMEVNGWHWNIDGPVFPGDLIGCAFTEPNGERLAAADQTAALAICRAALMVVTEARRR